MRCAAARGRLRESSLGEEDFPLGVLIVCAFRSITFKFCFILLCFYRVPQQIPFIVLKYDSKTKQNQFYSLGRPLHLGKVLQKQPALKHVSWPFGGEASRRASEEKQKIPTMALWYYK